MQTVQASVIFASSSYLYNGKALEDFFFFFFSMTFHTVNQAGLRNGNGSQTQRESEIVTTGGGGLVNEVKFIVIFLYSQIPFERVFRPEL